MKKMYLGLCLFVLVAFIGCAQQKPQAASSSEAITQAKTLPSADEQVKYLVNQANAFVNSKNFDDAINTAKYILSELDQNSQEAKSILEKAQEELKKMAGAKLDEMKGKLGVAN